jgi:protocatechuate 3,4-dioxygenase beta subunit
MDSTANGPVSRRAFIRTAFGAAISFVLAACGRQPSPEATTAPPTSAAPTLASAAEPSPAAPTAVPAQPTQPAPTGVAEALPPTPACGDDDDPTLAQTEGPFYTPDTPERVSFLEPGLAGTPMILSGQVLTTSCQPVAGALLDFWHADDAGNYDNAGFRLRGHQFADAEGRFSLETIVPGLYPGRTRHFHVKVQAPNQPVLTTQLYFPGEPDNDRDGIFHPDLLMDVQDTGAGKQAAFIFVLNAA